MQSFTDSDFETEVIKNPTPVFVEFFAVWCGPCQTAAPVIEEIAALYQGKIKVGKIDVDQSPVSAQKYGVMSIPTVIIFKNGQEAKRQVGFPGKEGYLKMIEETLG